MIEFEIALIMFSGVLIFVNWRLSVLRDDLIELNEKRLQRIRQLEELLQLKGED